MASPFLSAIFIAAIVFFISHSVWFLPSQGAEAAAATNAPPNTRLSSPSHRRCTTLVILGKHYTFCAPSAVAKKKGRTLSERLPREGHAETRRPSPAARVSLSERNHPSIRKRLSREPRRVIRRRAATAAHKHPLRRKHPTGGQPLVRIPATSGRHPSGSPRVRPGAAFPPRPVRNNGETLRNDFYEQTCPQVESIIRNKVSEWVTKDPSIAPSLLRLHFHDAISTGNDASILLKDPIRRSTEMYSGFNGGLRGFDVVDDIKLAVEKSCPGIVSCADILTVIARDVTLEMKGPFWFVPFGRKDSFTSFLSDAVEVPNQESDVNILLKQFDAAGLTFSDLAILTGAHSVGKSHCFSFTGAGAGGANPHMNLTYAQALNQRCKAGPLETVFNDDVTPNILDVQFYTNLKQGRVLFKSDDTIYRDNSMTSSLVDAFLSQPGVWDAQFAVSMVKLANSRVIADPNQGEIRRICSVPNNGLIHH
ncbi:hypothetical protein KP509_18G033100 [Ceratopteris richardii]|uniref:Plant heme peroxidase family profile domain-containing protein n=1 Tax=Ceratopteris richardii TaxID=49495 RepID=A0A8T2SRS5_CERRI|nr:hypothetical protein KP509_18G033100 [Ceratopteris richardii]